MTGTSVAHDQEFKRYPLSFTQEWFLTMDKGDDGGPFSRRFLLASALRVTGPVDLAVLQGALDDVVARHELLRTLVVRDADPPYQQIWPPCQVPLEIRDPPPVPGKSRDRVVQELILEVQAGTVSARQVPLMKALLARFGDRDSALFLTVHHSVSDGWSIEVILRDLGTFYAARASGTPPKLTLPIAEGATEVRASLEEEESSDIPTGTVWYMGKRPDGALSGGVHYNLEEFEASTAQGWISALKQILAGAVRDPDQNWRQL